VIRAVIIGAAGRMGRALLKAAAGFPELTISGAIVRTGSPAPDPGVLAGAASLGVALSTDLAAALEQADVAIDFSSPAAAAATLAACRAAHVGLLLGTTGLPAELEPQLAAAAHDIPLLRAANTSLGVTLLAELVRLAASRLPESFDIEIIEAHHRAKRDAPSGTALALGAAAAQGRGIPPPDGRSAGRQGPRPPGEIGFAVVRGGDIVGEHTVLMAGDGEQLCLTHRATDRMIFARGALQGALWLARQPPGSYTMRDLLQLNQ
jgi:4-hydroxy-tetrahydrodipicolinate reductase